MEINEIESDKEQKIENMQGFVNIDKIDKFL